MSRSALWSVRVVLVLLVGVPVVAGIVLGGADVVGSIAICVIVFGVPLVLGWAGLRSYKALVGMNIAVAAPLVVSMGLFSYRPDGLSQGVSGLLLLYLLGAFVINMIRIIRCWENDGITVLAPMGIAVSAVVLMVVANRIGHGLRADFFAGHLTEYNAAVEEVASRVGDEPLLLMGNNMPAQYRHLGHGLYGMRDSRDVLVVEFLWGSGFPLKHSVFVYRSDGRLPKKGTEFRRRWPRCERINEHWFRAGD